MSKENGKEPKNMIIGREGEKNDQETEEEIESQDSLRTPSTNFTLTPPLVPPSCLLPLSLLLYPPLLFPFPFLFAFPSSLSHSIIPSSGSRVCLRHSSSTTPSLSYPSFHSFHLLILVLIPPSTYSTIHHSLSLLFHLQYTSSSPTLPFI